MLLQMDDLNIHRHPVIDNVIHDHRHHVVFCAPYWTCNGAIEHVFNMLQPGLQMDVNGVDNKFDLVNKINSIIGGMPSYKRSFYILDF